MATSYTIWLHSETANDPPQTHWRNFRAGWPHTLIKAGYEPHPWPDDLPRTFDNVEWLRMTVRVKARVIKDIREKFAQLRAEIAARPIDPPIYRDPYASIDWEAP